MAFDAFVVYVTAAPHLVRGFGMTQAQADTRAAEDAAWSAHQGQVSDIPDGANSGGDWLFNTATDNVHRVGQSQMDIIVERRNTLLTLARQLETVAGLAAWTAGELNAATALSIRAKSYARWVELITRAISIDANLSNDDIHKVLLREASHPGRVWYWLHRATDDGGDGFKGLNWADAVSFTSESRLGWTWYSTTGPDAHDATVRIAAADALNPDTRGYVQGAQVIDGGINPSINAGEDFNWIHYLAA